LLLQLRRNFSLKVRDWKPYLVKSLLNRASRLARTRRRISVLESSLDSWLGEPVAPEPDNAAHRLMPTCKRLGNSDRRLLTLLESFNGNISSLAKHLGHHRNTLHRRLRTIRRTMSLFEIESAPYATVLSNSPERLQLEALIQKPHASAREVLRARLILDALDGLTYEQIVRRRRTSMSTIARWRERFAQGGAAGLKARHPGRKPKRHVSRPGESHCQ
jgi:hypothetical protein